jgi:Tol biopolymer transport system component
MNIGDPLSEAIRLIKTGQKDQARPLLLRVLQANPRNEAAWLWLVDALPDDAQRIAALEQCLKHNPTSRAARQGIERLKARQQPAESRLTRVEHSPLPTEMAGPLSSHLRAADRPTLPADQPAPTSREEQPVASLQPSIVDRQADGSTRRPSIADRRLLEATPEPQTAWDELRDLRKGARGGKIRAGIAALASRRWLLVGLLIVLVAIAGIVATPIAWNRIRGAGQPDAIATPPHLATAAAETQLAAMPVTQTASPTPLPSLTLTSTLTRTPYPTRTHTPSPTPSLTPSITQTEAPTNLALRFVAADGCTVQTIGLGGEQPTTLTTSPPAYCENAQLSPDGKWIAFQVRQAATLYVMAVDGSPLTKIVDQADQGGQIFGFAWSPNSARLAYAANTSEQPASLYLINADGTLPVGLNFSGITLFNHLPLGMAWSPNQQWIYAPASSAPPRPYPFVFAVAGSQSRSLADNQAVRPNIPAAWSPDGKKLAYVAIVGNWASIAIWGQDGTYITIPYNDPLTDSSIEGGEGQFISAGGWSPDGKHLLAFSFATDTQAYRLTTIQVENSQQTDLTTLTGFPGHAAWSPDGTRVAFIVKPSAESPTGGLYVIKADGSRERLLIEPVLDTTIIWERLP